MSHFTTIHTQIKDIEALRQACQELGLELLSDAEARGYGDTRQPGEFVVTRGVGHRGRSERLDGWIGRESSCFGQ